MDAISPRERDMDGDIPDYPPSPDPTAQVSLLQQTGSPKSSIELQLLDPKQKSAAGQTPASQQLTFQTAGATPRKLLRWMIGAYVSALIIALANALMFHYLNRKIPEKTIDQTTETFVANMVSLLFGISLTYAVGIAYTQEIWSTFRSKPLKVRTIDALISLPRAPWTALNADVMRQARFAWIIGLFCALFPVAVTFPPSALIVEPAHWPNKTEIRVPSLDLEFFGRDSEESFIKDVYSGNTTQDHINKFREEAIFKVTSDSGYVMPKQKLSSIVLVSMLSGDAQTPTMPGLCEANCTYSLNLLGPAFSCRYVDPNDALANATNTADPSRQAYGAFQAMDLFLNASSSSFKNSFQLSWYPDGPPNITINVRKDLNAMDCVTSFANYSVMLNYTSGVGRVQKYNITSAEPWDKAEFDAARYFYSNFQDRGTERDKKDLLVKLRRASAYAIRQATVSSLVGEIYTQGPDHAVANGTNILGTRLGSFDLAEKGLHFNITPAGIEELLRNATFSVMALDLWNSTTTVSLANWRNRYSFNEMQNLYIPYGLCLFIGAIILFKGSVALERNGVVANDSFTQILCTSQASDRLRAMLKDQGLGDNARLPEAVREMKLQYGELMRPEVQGEIEGQAPRSIGFGIPDEVRPLRQEILWNSFTLRVGLPKSLGEFVARFRR